LKKIPVSNAIIWAGILRLKNFVVKKQLYSDNKNEIYESGKELRNFIADRLYAETSFYIL